MEVHHVPDIRPKKFKEYVFEGLMIFMAVTLGFFAEKIRENLSERMKEKEYIVSMIEDAKTDTANFQKSINLNKMRVLKLDTMATRCFNYGTLSNDDASLYRLLKACIKHPDFVCPVERTISQLKNASNMRLLRSTVADDSIVFYEDIVKKVVNQQAYYELHLNVLIEATEGLFNMKYFPLDAQTLKWETKPNTYATAKLISHQKTRILEFGNKAKLFQGIVLFYIMRLEEAKWHAVNLIETLEKEYKH
ncbi:MAG: hypothetical protein WCQ95_13075 [Bacteroidota bacterium]